MTPECWTKSLGCTYDHPQF